VLFRSGEAPLIDPAAIRPGSVVVDLVYHPRATRLVEAAARRGARAHGGLGMLVHQAALAFEIWTGTPAPLPAMWAAADSAVVAR
jgi:shikimate dehydrogenase